jgi:hypothetical protein
MGRQNAMHGAVSPFAINVSLSQADRPSAAHAAGPVRVAGTAALSTRTKRQKQKSKNNPQHFMNVSGASFS